MGIGSRVVSDEFFVFSGSARCYGSMHRHCDYVVVHFFIKSNQDYQHYKKPCISTMHKEVTNRIYQLMLILHQPSE